jgi:DNA invertase Pin-like site-specific DNA recombinase
MVPGFPRPRGDGPEPEVLPALRGFLDTLGVFAEFETNLRRERQLEGIAKAKAAGVYKGRPASIDEHPGRRALLGERSVRGRDR